ncbi:hypothetical protein MACK_001366 [Theileria orientalis]|uniref:Phosphate transporter n=1 Tax=Theileria orientalis TaxID=68886 RepID=A0A976QX79_THEOR|nr:hypothetical protein MACK_001366 [Theileria orientalis]
MEAAEPQLIWIVIVCGIVSTIMAMSIGANDVANAFSTSIGTGALNLPGAITIAFIFEVLGSIVLGGRVTDSIRNKVLNFDAFSDSPFDLALGMLCSSIGATSWLILATLFGIPVSTTHGVIGALAGFGVASGRTNGVRWSQFLYIVASWFVVPIISIFATAILYILLQELVLTRENSYRIMKNYHWVFLALFSIPLSLFIAFENCFLKTGKGKLADLYRTWFYESYWHKALSVFIIVMTLLVLSSIVTYTISHFRINSGWSFLKPRDVHSIFARKKKKKKAPLVVERVEEPVDTSEQTEVYEEINKENSDLLVTNLTSLNTDSNKSEDAIEFPMNVERSRSLEMNIVEDQLEPNDKSFSKSVINALLGSVGFPQSPRGSRAPSDLSNGSINYDDESGLESGPHAESKVSSFFSNMKGSYGLSMSKFPKITSISGSSPNPATSCSDISKSSSRIKGSKSEKKSKKRQKATSSFSGFKNMPHDKRKLMNDTQTIFSAMQVVGTTISIVSRSANYTANAVSTFATVYFLYLYGVEQTPKNTPWYILLAGGVAMAFGLALFGYKVIKTVGLKITRVTPSRAYTIDSTAGGIVLIFSQLGIPVSSTHVTVSAILGIGMIQHVPSFFNPNIKHFKDTSHDAINLDGAIISGDENASNINLDTNLYASRDKSYPDSPLAEISFDTTIHRNLDSMETQKDDCMNVQSYPFRKRFTLEYVNLKLYRKIFLSWIITIFSSGFVTAIFFLIAKAIYNAKR